MTPRERVLTSLNHEEPDRIPIDLAGTGVTSLHALVYHGIRKLLRFPDKPIRIYDFGNMTVDIEKEALEYFGVDVISIDRVADPCPSLPKPFDKCYGWQVWRTPSGINLEVPSCVKIVEEENEFKAYWNNRDICIMPKNGQHFWCKSVVEYLSNPPLANAKSIEDVKNFNWDLFKFTDEEVEIALRRAMWFYRNTNYVLVMPIISKINGLHHKAGQVFRGFTKWLADLKLRRPLAEALLDHALEVILFNVHKLFGELRGYIHIGIMSDDLGTEEKPQISVQLFREVYKHRYEEIIKAVKKYNVYMFLHSDGSIFPLIKEFIDIGLDIINPVQISAKDMDPEKLKKEYGEQITFWGGGADTQHILPFAKPEEVVNHVKKLIKVFAPGGGFVFAPVHNIQPPTPAENVVAMYETALKYGNYPIKID
ncbi:MAG: uroporphyrinogen decarboxylase family protein [Ignisphaera sp.]|uniref:Uroporphyrinogen decarboxylase (URO-D) domain-containing protein n=1 Tax=Ignisphaera aggregans TaxID=334771 RepID=A0A7C4JLK3_9CREN